MPPPALASAAASSAGMASPSESSGDSTAVAVAGAGGMLGGRAEAVVRESCDTSIIEMPFSEAHLTPLILDL